MATTTRKRSLEPEEHDTVLSPLAASAITGVLGLLFGGTAAILRPSPKPGFIAAKFGIHGAIIGGTFSGLRLAFLSTRVKDEITPTTRVYGSSIAGGLSMAITGTVMRLRPSVPGVIGGALIGFLGQTGYNWLDKRKTESITSPVVPKDPLWRRLANSKYSPMTVLTDEQYEALLREKLLRVDTEIAIIEDDIAQIRRDVEIEKSKK